MPLLGGLERNASDIFKLSDDEDEGLTIPQRYDVLQENSRLRKCLSLSPSMHSPQSLGQHFPVDDKFVPRKLRQPKTVDIHEIHPLDSKDESRVSLRSDAV